MDSALDAVYEFDRGFPPEVLAGFCGIQRDRMHLTGSGRGVSRRRRHTDSRGDLLVHLVNGGLLTGSDVVGPHSLYVQPGGAHERVNDVIDINVVTDGGAVAVDGDRAPGDEGAAENRNRA